MKAREAMMTEQAGKAAQTRTCRTIRRIAVGTLSVALLALGARAEAQSSGGRMSAPGALPQPSGATATSPRAKFEPAGDGVFHGASLTGTWQGGDLRAQFQRYQRAAGKRLSVVTWYASYFENGSQALWQHKYAMPLKRVKDIGALSLIKFSIQDPAFSQNHKILDLKKIAQGVYDAYWEGAAETVRDFRDPVFISINHEMNGTWYPFSEAYDGSAGPAPRVSAADFVAAWRRIVDVFRQKGADNVAWVWSPNVPDVGPVLHNKYYPGDDYVDWVGVSFYSGNPMSNLNAIYRAYAPRKPIFITEWATGDDKSKYYQGYPGNAKWVASFFQALDKNYPRVKAISWFQHDKERYGEANYFLDRELEQQQVYASSVQNPRYIDSAGGLSSQPPGGVVSVPLQSAPREVVLREAAPIEKQAIEKPRVEGSAASAAPRRPRLQIVPRERVLTER